MALQPEQFARLFLQEKELRKEVSMTQQEVAEVHKKLSKAEETLKQKEAASEDKLNKLEAEKR